MMPRPDQRPLNLSLRHFHFPLNAWLSIAHRLSGILLVIGLFCAIVILSHVLLKPDSFVTYQAWLTQRHAQILLLLFAFALWFHWLAGLRFLLLDFCINPTCQRFVRAAAKTHLSLWLLGCGAIVIGWLA